MYIQFLIEDISGSKLIDEIMIKYKAEKSDADIEYNIKSFKGIGHFPKGCSAINAKTQKLLNDLTQYLRGFDKSLQHMPDASIFIVLDNDTRKTEEFKIELEQAASQAMIAIDHVFCIAVEEMEAWLLGDRSAIEKAYPNFNNRIVRLHPGYRQDSICGTWEVLADILYIHGLQRFKKDNPTYIDVGRHKCKWAEDIGKHMDIRNNVSPSFQYMLQALDTRIALTC